MCKIVYDEQQRRAIDAMGGHFLVLAPPGCGKTDILAERIAEACRRGVDMADMLCLTFTNRASRGMRSRVKQKVGQDADAIFIGNVHRYCSKYLFANNVVSEMAGILDEDDQINVLIEIGGDYFKGRNGAVNKNAVSYVTGLAAYIVQTRLYHPESAKVFLPEYLEDYALAKDFDFDCYAPELKHCAAGYALTYLNYKEQNNLIDFDDILIRAYDHMRHHEHDKYRWIQIDEVQDLNPLQMSIVDELTADDATVMYLGDEQQAIFSFMGAKLEILGMLKERCRGNLLTLGTNYRSLKYLLDVCNDYATEQLGVDPDLLPHPNNDAKAGKFDLVLTESETIEVEQKRILKMVNYYLGLDLKQKERLAILVTKNQEADDISATLSAAGVPNFKISGLDMFRTSSYKTLSAFFAVLVNDHSFLEWSRLLYGTGAISSLSKARNFVTELREAMLTPSDLLAEEPYLQRFMRAWDDEEVVIFDTETTGLDVDHDHIVQIAAFKVRGGVKVPGSDFNIVLETDREIPQYFVSKEVIINDFAPGQKPAVTQTVADHIYQTLPQDAYSTRMEQSLPNLDSKIDQSMLDFGSAKVDQTLPRGTGARRVNPMYEYYATHPHMSRREALDMFLHYVGNRPVLGHNVNYDYQILSANVKETLGREIELETFDSLRIIKLVEPRLRNYKLETLIEVLGLQGQNSHMADEDIEATKSLVDYCVAQIRPVLAEQRLLLQRVVVRNAIERMRPLKAMFNNIRKYLYKPIAQTEITLADEIGRRYSQMREMKLIDDIGEKFDIFLRFVAKEWRDLNPEESLYTQLCQHIYDITATINEGDLVNSDGLISNRVFIMTVYKGKGLEFDNVVVLSANKGSYPFYMVERTLNNPNADPRERRIAQREYDEDARKFYVAITRAKQRLCISYTKYGPWGHYAGVTPFIKSIREHFNFFRGNPN